MREGGDDVEWMGKALTAVETERVWNGERGSVGEALKTVWVVGWRCRQLFEACYFFLTGRQAKTNPSGFHWRRPKQGSADTSKTLARAARVAGSVGGVAAVRAVGAVWAVGAVGGGGGLGTFKYF